MSGNEKRVAVVGGGVIGLCVAYYLRRKGFDVIVLERDETGSGASRGNAGWIVPGLSLPLAAPGTMAQSLRWLGRDGPLVIRPQLNASFIHWCWSFWRNCSARRYAENMQALVQLNQGAADCLDRMSADGVNFEMHTDGLLFVARSDVELWRQEEAHAKLREAGYNDTLRVFDRSHVHEFEPALSEDVAGGLWAANERDVRPESLVAGLAAKLEAAGVSIYEGFDVQEIVRRHGEWRLHSPATELAAGRVVVACGAWSQKLLRSVGVSLLMQPAKGYSITAQGEGIFPSRPLYLAETRVGTSTFGDRLRVVGNFELTGLDLRLDPERINALWLAALRYLREWTPVAIDLEWAGLRPSTPDSLPFVGALPGLDNLYVATGHGMLGVTGAAPTGELLADLMAGEDSPALLPFRPDRKLVR